MLSANKIVKDLVHTIFKKSIRELSFFNLEKRKPKKNLISGYMTGVLKLMEPNSA